MRVLFFILVIFGFSVSGQTPFEKATQSANRGNYKQALENYGQALLNAENERAGDDFTAKIHFNIGICRYHLKQANEAVREFTKAITLSKGKYQKAFYALGIAQTELKKRREAEAAFLNSLKLKKDDGEAWFDLALIYIEEQNFEAAETTFQNSIKYKSIASADAHNNLGVILTIKGNYLSAEKEFETALRKSNDNLPVAAANLRFCRALAKEFSRDLIANLEFTQFYKINNEIGKGVITYERN